MKSEQRGIKKPAEGGLWGRLVEESVASREGEGLLESRAVVRPRDRHPVSGVRLQRRVGQDIADLRVVCQ